MLIHGLPSAALLPRCGSPLQIYYILCKSVVKTKINLRNSCGDGNGGAVGYVFLEKATLAGAIVVGCGPRRRALSARLSRRRAD